MLFVTISCTNYTFLGEVSLCLQKNSRESFNSNQTKALRRTGMFLVLLLPMKRTSTKMKKSIQEMIDRYGRKTHNVANNSGEHTLCRLLIIFHRALE